MRLNKYLSETGMCSRREADTWIASGRVSINGKRAELGTQVTEADEVRVDNRMVGTRQKKKKIYICLNKPVGITCTTERDVHDNIIDFIGHEERIFPIGRLDKESEGLILLTNNGDIVNDILRSENNHEKEYLVSVDKPVTDAFISGMSRGVRIPDRPLRSRSTSSIPGVVRTQTKPCAVSRIGKYDFRIILTQGLNRQIRRMCEVFAFDVRRLQRVRIVNIRLGALKLGRWRNLTEAELRGLLPERKDW